MIEEAGGLIGNLFAATDKVIEEHGELYSPNKNHWFFKLSVKQTKQSLKLLTCESQKVFSSSRFLVDAVPGWNHKSNPGRRFALLGIRIASYYKFGRSHSVRRTAHFLN